MEAERTRSFARLEMVNSADASKKFVEGSITLFRQSSGRQKCEKQLAYLKVMIVFCSLLYMCVYVRVCLKMFACTCVCAWMCLCERERCTLHIDPSTAPPFSCCYREVSQVAAGKRECEPV